MICAKYSRKIISVNCDKKRYNHFAMHETSAGYVPNIAKLHVMYSLHIIWDNKNKYLDLQFRSSHIANQAAPV